MQNAVERGGSRGGTWPLQAISGIVLLFLLGLHVIAQHFVAAEGMRNFQDVLSYIRNPLILVLEVVFLVVVTYHAMLGVRGVVADLGLTRQQENTVNVVLTLVGVVLVAWGVYLAWFLVARA
jgi:succinate dehydrogenase / fumarate reductase membrane anchor subunit